MRSSPTGARRSLFGVGGGAAIGLPRSHSVPAATAAPIDVGMPCDPGVAALWTIRENALATTACQPANDNHPLRTPKGVVPWHSDELEAGDYFEVTLTGPGVGFCTPHDVAGRIEQIAGAPRQPGMLSLRFFKDIPETTSWREAPHAAPVIFPTGAGTAHDGRASVTPRARDPFGLSVPASESHAHSQGEHS
jgi:hypothetical protein